MELISPSGNVFNVGKRIGKGPIFTSYICLTKDGREVVLKIANTAAESAYLDREAYALGVMKVHANLLEEEYALTPAGKKGSVLNYQISFPELVETFLADERQDFRRVNILDFSNTSKELADLKPIEHILNRLHHTVDAKTSAWMLGKLLKVLVFTHSQGIQLGDLSGENILINPGQHYVAFGDWSSVTLHDGPLPQQIVCDEISQITKAIVLSLGGHPKTGKLLPSDQLVDHRYEAFLKQMLQGDVATALATHTEFYKLIRSLWPRGFHPFTTLPVEE